MRILLIIFFVTIFVWNGTLSQTYQDLSTDSLIRLAESKSAEQAPDGLEVLLLGEIAQIELALAGQIDRIERSLANSQYQTIDDGVIQGIIDKFDNICDESNGLANNDVTLRVFSDLSALFRNSYLQPQIQVESIFSLYTNGLYDGGTLSLKQSSINCQPLKEDLVVLAGLAEELVKDSEKAWDDELQRVTAQQPRAESAMASLRQRAAEIRTKVSQERTRADLNENLYLLIGVIGAFGVITIAAVRLFPPDVILEWVASGQVIQFVTVTILLTVVLSLGLSGVLKENTLGTLLGGIGGYVLSQGVGRAAAHQAQRDAARGSEQTASTMPPVRSETPTN